MTKYDYADYNTLPPDQKVLWWFDEYLRYDLVFAYAPLNPLTGGTATITFLIERYTTYRYDWAYNYSYELWNLCNTTDLVINRFLNERVDYKLHHKDVLFKIPPNDTGTPIVITYLADEPRHISPLGRLFLVTDNLDGARNETITPEGEIWQLKKAQTDYACYTKHVRIVKSSTNEQTVKLSNVASYSIVLTTDPEVKKTDIEDANDEYLFYKNINKWQQKLATAPDVEYMSSSVVNDYSSRGARVVYEPEIDLNLFQGVPPSEPDLSPPSQGELDSAGNTYHNLNTRTWDAAISSHLIYSKIPDTMFDGIFTEDKLFTPNNQTLGLFVSIDDLLYLYLNRTLNYDLVPTQVSLTGNVVLTDSHTFWHERIYIGQDPNITNKPYLHEIWSFKIDGAEYDRSYVTAQYWNINLPYERWKIRTVQHYSLHVVGSRTFGDIPPLHLSRILNRNYPYIERRPLPLPLELITTINDLIILEEYAMGFELKIDEIHACLGASEFAYYDDSGQQREYYMSIARKLDWFAKAYGVAFNPDGTIMETRQRVSVPYDKTNKVKIPDGWTRGQFADNEGGTNIGQTGGQTGEKRMGIAYQNRCNQYDNFDDTDPLNNTMKRGDVVLCENFLQLFESYLEDMDKGLNWQEMGTGVMPSADGSSFCTYEGMGTLLAEVAYMLSQLSSNIYQTHNLSAMNYAVNKEIMKAIGVPIVAKVLPLELGESTDIGSSLTGSIFVPAIADNAPNITQQLGILLSNIALVLSNYVELPKKEAQTP
jgi:hypothetical protein